MTAITCDRDTPLRESVSFHFPAKGGAVFYAGALVAIDSATGLACPCTGTATQTVVGIARWRLDTTNTADGESSVTVRRGLVRVSNDPANAYTLKDVGTSVNALDNATVSKAAGAAAKAGVLRDIDPNGDAWIEL